MKRFLCAACACVVVLGCNAYADETCSLATLRGTMAWAVNYQKAGMPRSGSGFESYDGLGHLKYTEIVSDGYTTSTYSGTGSYTLGANCIATVTYDGGPTPFVYFVAPSGAAYFWTNNQNAGATSAGKAERVSFAQLVK
ncbi:MAG: hypothetical protein JSR73_04425 [Proteobacteria bacterium]|nr:hypothetical protein [Pseudomonadota bacterium]